MNKDEAIQNIMQVAAKLLTVGPSDFREDYPKSVPNYIVLQMKQHREVQRLMAIKLRDSLTELRKNNE